MNLLIQELLHKKLKIIFLKAQGVKDTLSDPGKLAGEALEGGLVAGGASRIASEVAGPPPTQRVIHSNIETFTPTSHKDY